MKMKIPTKQIFITLAAAAIIYGVDKCNANLNKKIEITQQVNRFAVKSLTDSFNIKLNTADSVLFSKYLKDLTANSIVNQKIYDLYKIGRDTNLLKNDNFMLNRDKIILDLYSGFNMHITSELDSMQKLLEVRLAKYPEYNKFQKHWNATLEKEGFTKIFSKKYVPKKDTIKPKEIIKKPVPKARSNLMKPRSSYRPM